MSHASMVSRGFFKNQEIEVTDIVTPASCGVILDRNNRFSVVERIDFAADMLQYGNTSMTFKGEMGADKVYRVTTHIDWSKNKSLVRTMTVASAVTSILNTFGLWSKSPDRIRTDNLPNSDLLNIHGCLPPSSKISMSPPQTTWAGDFIRAVGETIACGADWVVGCACALGARVGTAFRLRVLTPE